MASALDDIIWEQVALIAVVGTIGVIASLSNNWNVAGDAVSGCLGALAAMRLSKSGGINVATGGTPGGDTTGT